MARRRQFIAALAAGSTGGLAGCGGGSPGTGTESSTETNSGNTPDDGSGLSGSYQFFRGTRGRTAYFPNRSASVEPISQSWQYDTKGSLEYQPLVKAGSIYTVDRDGRAYAIDPATQSEQWRTSVADGIDSSPAVAGGKLYVPGDGGVLYAVTASSGEIDWQYEIDGGSVLSPVVVDNTVYLSGSTPGSGQITALDSSSGSVRWSNDTGTSEVVRPAFSDGTLYYRENSGIVAADTDGETQWIASNIGYKMEEIATDGSMVYANVGGNEATQYSDRENAKVVALNASDGTESWRHEADTPYLRRQLRVGSDGVYIVTGGTIQKLGLESGEVLWSESPPGNQIAATVVYGDALYVTGEARLTALETSDGSQRWQTKANFGTFEPVLVDGTVFVNVKNSVRAFQ